MTQWNFYKRINKIAAISLFTYLSFFLWNGSLVNAAPVREESDGSVKVSTYSELQNAIANNSPKIVFTNNIDADKNVALIVKNKTIEIDGAGYTLDFKKNPAGSFLLNYPAVNTSTPNLILKDMNLKKDSSLLDEPFVSTSSSDFVYVQFQGEITFDEESSNGYVKVPYGKISFVNSNVKGFAPAVNSERTAFEAKQVILKDTKMNIDQDKYNIGKSSNIFASKTEGSAYYTFDNSEVILKYDTAADESYKYSLFYFRDGVYFTVKNGSRLHLFGKSQPLFIGYVGYAIASSISIESSSSVELSGENGLLYAYETSLSVDDAKLILNGNANRSVPLLRFLRNRDFNSYNQISIKNFGEIRSTNKEKDFVASSNSSPNVVHMEGPQSQILVGSGGKLILDNRLFNVPPANGINSPKYAAIRFTNVSSSMKYPNTFRIDDAAVPITAEGKRTEVNINSDYGPAIARDGNNDGLYIYQSANTIMQLKGSTADSTSSGVILGENAEVNFVSDRPYFYDFTNVRKDGGNVFGSNVNASLKISGTNFSVWDHKADISSAPSYYYSGEGIIQYIGVNLKTVGPSMDPTFGSKLPYLNKGKAKRLFGTKAAPIFTGLRAPTNTDKRIIASVAFSGGGTTAAFIPSENAIYAKLKITGVDGSVKTMISGVKGFNSAAGTGGVRTWEEAGAQGGRIEFTLDSYLKTNDEVEIIDIWRYTEDPNSPDALHGDLSGIITKQKVADVIPPGLLYVDEDFTKSLVVGQKTLKVGANNKNHSGDEVEIFINNHYTAATQIKEDGSFSLTLDQPLYAKDVVQLSVRNHSGSVLDNTSTLNSKFQRPATNNDIGNGNPIDADYPYHDQLFPKAVNYIVKDRIPPTADSKITPIKLGDSQSIITGDAKSFLVNIKDDVSSAEKITAKLTAGQDIEKLVSTIGLKELFIDLTDEAGNTAKIKTQINVYEDSLIVEFITANHEALHPPIKLKRAGAIDLTKEQAVVEAIAEISSQNYYLYERPTNETQIMVPPQSDLTVTYKFDGSLNLISAPKTFDFGIKAAKITPEKFTTPKLTGEPLIVSDTRADKVTWQLKAKLDQPLTSVEDKHVILPDAINYNDHGEKRTLTNEDVLIFSHLNTTSGKYNVTEERWAKGDGFELEMPAGVVKSLGKYQAKLTITLENAK